MSTSGVPMHGDVVDPADPVAVWVNHGSPEKVCQGDHLTGDRSVHGNLVAEACRNGRPPPLFLAGSVLVGHRSSARGLHLRELHVRWPVDGCDLYTLEGGAVTAEAHCVSAAIEGVNAAAHLEAA